MGSKLKRVGRGWGMRWIMEVLACLLGFYFSFLLFTAWVLQKFQAALEFDRKLDGVTGVTRLE